MGLDIALGVMILLGAIRGWFRGFVSQAVRLGGLVASAYAAGPIRDLARPYVAPYLQTIDPSLMGRMLWWSSAVVAYIAIVGLAGLVSNVQRRRTYIELDSNRPDQFAGFLLASFKGAVVVAFLVGAIDRYVLAYARQVPWAAEQARTSRALAWHEHYQPAERIWTAPPVQTFIAHVRKMGVDAPGTDSEPKSPGSEAPPVQTAAARPPRLRIHAAPVLNPKAPDFVRKFDEALRRVERP